MRKLTATKRHLATIASVALLAVPLAACSTDSNADTGSSAPAPVAAIDSLSGESTAIALDKGFTDALTSLKLTPGVVGSAELVDGSLGMAYGATSATFLRCSRNPSTQ